MKDSLRKCYACGGKATSKEHVPPKCIFPPLEDAGIDYRKNLISVPACDKHNAAKSTDDQHLLFVLLMHFGNNQLGKDHFFKKLMRAVDRTPKQFRKYVKKHFPVTAEGKRFVAVQLDRNRFDQSMKLVVKALYYHVTKTQLAQPVGIISPIFLTEHPEGATGHEASLRGAAMTRSLLNSIPFRGENADIFKYRYLTNPDERMFAVEMIYYERFSVYGYSAPGLVVD